MSKYKAETELRQVSCQTGMEVVSIRPPLVYGPRVKANFLKLMNLVYTGLPLPFAKVANARSFVAIDNLTDAISLCVTHPAAANETFIVCDPDPLSTPDLLRKISCAMEIRLRLFYCPRRVAETLAGLTGKQGIYNRLWGNLAASSEKIRQCLGWTPKISVDDELNRTVTWYCAHAGSRWRWERE
jgi:nucleoside-diphosphate-sugar epimerase